MFIHKQMIEKNIVCFLFVSVLFDIQYLNTTHEIASFWHGFTDIGSGIDAYRHCVSTPKYRGRCDIVDAAVIGLTTKVTVLVGDELQQG